MKNNIALPKRWTIAQQLAIQRDRQAALTLDHTVRSLAARSGLDAPAAQALVLEARSVFTITNAIPRALAPDGQPLLGDNGFPLTVEAWTLHRLATAP